MKVRISKDGLKAVYSDNLIRVIDRLSSTKEITRASNVEYNPILARWEAKTDTGEIIANDPLREKCLRKERDVVESRL